QASCDYDGSGLLSDNCFILRAPRGLQTALMAAHGLVKVRDLAASDLDVVLVQGPPSLLPETTLS
ncbi:MAG: hypothetical protein GTN89_10560, partial [Acidobacteria bacterium]|nr:hypothetical protein [Acidobacteriota bacterium]NIQ30790.1 hypothetical protein [Acidobacteriota bacterium]